MNIIDTIIFDLISFWGY